MKKVFLNSAVMLVSLVLISCANAGSVAVREGTGQKFKATDSFKLVHEKGMEKGVEQDTAKWAPKFEAAFAKEVTAKKMYPLNPSKPNYTVHYHFTEIDQPNGFLNAVGSSNQNSKVTFSVFIKAAGRQISSLEVKGDSSMQSRSSIGGINLTGVESKTHNAVEAAAARLVEWMETQGENYVAKK